MEKINVAREAASIWSMKNSGKIGVDTHRVLMQNRLSNSLKSTFNTKGRSHVLQGRHHSILRYILPYTDLPTDSLQGLFAAVAYYNRLRIRNRVGAIKCYIYISKNSKRLNAAKNTDHIKKKTSNKSCSELNFVQKSPQTHMAISCPHPNTQNGAGGSKDRYGWNIILYWNGKLHSI